MGARALVPYRSFLIERIKPNRFGYYERTTYLGNPRLKPKGWRIIRED